MNPTIEPGKWDFTPVVFSLEDTAFLQIRDVMLDALVNAFCVPPELVADEKPSSEPPEPETWRDRPSQF